MPVEIRELTVRTSVDPEGPNVPDATPIELPEMVIRTQVGSRAVELREMVISASMDEFAQAAPRGGPIMLPGFVIQANVGSPARNHAIEVPELVIKAQVTAVNTFALRIPMRVLRPSFGQLASCYADYLEMPKPCTNPRATNQCAVRMSTASARCGFPMNTFPDRRRIHRPERCRIQVPHVLGAQELEEFLRGRMVVTYEFGHGSTATAFDRVRGQTGIVFFDRVHGRTDHIDLFDGEKIQNEVLYGKDSADTLGYFDRAKRITFFRL